MSIGPTVSNQLAQRYYKLGTLATWGLPTMIVPVMRLAQDPPETRWKLFTRDFSTYALGAGFFFLASGIASKLMKTRVVDVARRNLYAVLAGVAANILFAGLAAPRIYPMFEALQKKFGRAKPLPLKPAPAFPTSQTLAPPMPTVYRPTFNPYHTLPPKTDVYQSSGGRPLGYQSTIR